MITRLVDAILNKRLISFEYGGLPRIAEPHVYGVSKGVEELQVYQVGGESSSGGLPQWRRIIVVRMTALELLPQTFPGQRPTPTHSTWDTIYALVQ